MAQKILLRKSTVQGGSPTVGQLDFGEVAVNYRDGKIFMKVTDGVTESIASIQLNATGQYGAEFALEGNVLEINDANGVLLDSVDLSGITPSALANYQLTSEKGQPNGYASLDGSGVIPTSQLPALAITDVSVVNTIVERDALTVQEGDVAIVTANIVDPDQNGTYIYDGANWQAVQAAGGNVTSVNGNTGAVTLAASDIDYNDLVTDVDGNPATTTISVQELGEALDSRVDTVETDVANNATLLGTLDTAVNDPTTGLLATVGGLTTDVGALQVDVGALDTTIGAGGTAGAANSFVGTDASGNFIYVAQGPSGGVVQSDGDGTFSVFDLSGALADKANVADVLASADLVGDTLNLRDSANNVIASVDLSALDNQTAAQVSFDPSTSSLTAVTTQLAIEEVNTKADANASAIAALGGGTLTADAFVYTDGTGSLATVVPTDPDSFLKWDGVNYVATNVIDAGTF